MKKAPDTYLHALVFEDFPPAVLELLQAGHDVNAKDDMGRTALHVVAAYGKIGDTLAHLLRAKPDLDVQDCEGMSPLMCAAMMGNGDLVMMLLVVGADHTLRDCCGRTAMDWGGAETDEVFWDYFSNASATRQ